MNIDDDLSISFASSIGVSNIKKEYLNKNNLYTDLDQLEKSVEAEFEQYMNQARTFPFHKDSNNTREEEKEEIEENRFKLKSASDHSDYDLLGAELLDQVNDDLNLDNDSWRQYLENNDVDEKYNVKPLRNNNTSLLKEEEDEIYTDSRNTSPGEYFGARSLPLNSMDNVWEQRQEQQQYFQSLDEEEEAEKATDNAFSFVSVIFSRLLFSSSDKC
jgi:hypothetical protein